ncbi:hypothetical protein DPMN_143959 [Dreissena polymorpha]|uniref:Uncharacterized protein n=1 Tax=Dreissena polymorpha TaxID=45954 RepID=A0A9D4JK58_DREPO|nr:hypothetical protein DPMN_143959 [Dreissena polymorpha]
MKEDQHQATTGLQSHSRRPTEYLASLEWQGDGKWQMSADQVANKLTEEEMAYV